MRRYNLLFLFIFLLSGCCSTTYSLHDKFVSLKPTIAPQALSGFWAGTSGGHSWALKINNNGTGTSCYLNRLEELKFDGSNFIVENAAVIKIKTINQTQLLISSPYEENIDYLLIKDDGKKLMSPFCQKSFEL